MPEFIACTLTEGEMAVVQEHCLSDADIVDFLVKCAEGGIKVSIGYDDYNDTCGCTLTVKPATPSGKGKALHSRGPSVQDAITVSAFKLHEKLGGSLDAGEIQETKRQWG